MFDNVLKVILKTDAFFDRRCTSRSRLAVVDTRDVPLEYRHVSSCSSRSKVAHNACDVVARTESSK